MSIFKKALGIFVEVDEKKAQLQPEGEAQEAPAVVLPDAPADLSQEPDIQRVREAVKLLADLPLADIPLEKARALIAKTLEFAGMEPEELAESFQRARGLYQAQVQQEEQQTAARRQLNQERMELLRNAMEEEQQQCEAELAARSRRIESAAAELGEVEKAMAFFAPVSEEKQA